MRFCERCGAMNEDDSRYCVSCGQPVDADVEMTPGPVMQEAFQQPAAAPEQTYADPNVIPPSIPQFGGIPEGYETNELPPWQDGGQFAMPIGAQAQQPSSDIAFSAAALQLDELKENLSGIAGTQASNGDHLRSAEEKIGSIDGRLDAIEKRLDKLGNQFEDKISRNEHEATALKQVSAEIEEYRNGLYEKLTMPYIRDIIDVRSCIKSTLARHKGEGSISVEEAEMFCDMLADALTRHSVEVIGSEEGDEFLSFKHKMVGKVPTNDPSLHGRIAEVEGESYRMGDKYIAPALVKIYTLDSAGSGSSVE